MTTPEKFKQVLEEAQEMFVQKRKDYGDSWKVYRPSTFTDLLWVKVHRAIRVESSGAVVNESLEQTLQSVVNYSIMALMVIDELCDYDVEHAHEIVSGELFDLFEKKNRDYDGSFKMMRMSSILDLMMGKLARIKEIEMKGTHSDYSEGIASEYMDIANYAVLAIIKLKAE